MLTRIEAQLPQLSPAERRVGDWIVAHPRAALEQDTRTLARQMAVSQPTLVRFARSLGCTGFQDFRMKLAQAMGPKPPAAGTTMSSIAASPDLDSLCRGLFNFTIDALAQLRDALDRDALARAIRMLDEAQRVTFFGFGNAVGAAQEALRRFMRIDLRVQACTDTHLQAVVTAQMRRGDVLVLLSPGGRDAQMLQAVDAVHAAGAATLALTTSGAPLQRRATLALAIDIPDSADALMPGTAQLAQLAVIDLLAIGVAARRSTRIVKRVQRARKNTT